MTNEEIDMINEEIFNKNKDYALFKLLEKKIIISNKNNTIDNELYDQYNLYFNKLYKK